MGPGGTQRAGVRPGGPEASAGGRPRDHKRRPCATRASRGGAKERRCGANTGRRIPSGKEATAPVPELGAFRHTAPLPTAKGERERLLSSATARSGRRDEPRHAEDEHHPLRARCALRATVAVCARRRAAGMGMAADSLSAPSLPAPSPRCGNRGISCQSRAGKLDLNCEKQNKSSQRRYGINTVLKKNNNKDSARSV